MRTDRGLASLPLERYRPMAGAGARGMLGVAFGITPDAPGLRRRCARSSSSTTRARMLRNTHVFDGVAELIEALCARGLRWGVVTNKSVRFTEPLTRAHAAVRDGAARSSAATRRRMPSRIPEPLLEAARRLGVAPDRCIYVGDDERDMHGGPGRRHAHGGRHLRLHGRAGRCDALGGRCRHRIAHGRSCNCSKQA